MYNTGDMMKKFLLLLLVINIFSTQVFALARCRYDYDGNKICKHVEPTEIRRGKSFRRVDMYDRKGRKISLYLKKQDNITNVINSQKHHIGYGFEDYRGNIHIVEKGKIVKTFYVSKI